MCGPDLCSNSQVGAHFMKFRLVWMGPEDDPDASPAARKPISQASSSRPSFQQRGTEMVRHEKMADGHVKVTALANFTARIVRDLLLDDDAGGRRDFEFEAELDGRRIRFVLPAAEFGRMAWVLPHIGPRAIIYPGQHQHARAAIQSLSGPVHQEHIFTHLLDQGRLRMGVPARRRSHRPRRIAERGAGAIACGSQGLSRSTAERSRSAGGGRPR